MRWTRRGGSTGVSGGTGRVTLIQWWRHGCLPLPARWAEGVIMYSVCVRIYLFDSVICGKKDGLLPLGGITDPSLAQRRASVVEAGPPLSQRWAAIRLGWGSNRASRMTFQQGAKMPRLSQTNWAMSIPIRSGILGLYPAAHPRISPAQQGRTLFTPRSLPRLHWWSVSLGIFPYWLTMIKKIRPILPPRTFGCSRRTYLHSPVASLNRWGTWQVNW